MSYLLPHLHSGWAVDQAILAEEERLVVIRFGHDWDETCMQVGGSLTKFLDKLKESGDGRILIEQHHKAQEVTQKVSQNRYISKFNIDPTLLQAQCPWNQLPDFHKGQLWQRMQMLPWGDQLNYLRGKYPVSQLFQVHPKELAFFLIPHLLRTNKKLLIFDLNGIFFNIVKSNSFLIAPAVRLKSVDVYMRPDIIKFLNFIHMFHTIAIWTSHTNQNTNALIDSLFRTVRKKFFFVWTESHSTEISHPDLHKNTSLFLKELSKVWLKFKKFNPANTLLVDTNPLRSLINPGYTSLYLPRFIFDPDQPDDLLKVGGRLTRYLDIKLQMSGST